MSNPMRSGITVSVAVPGHAELYAAHVALPHIPRVGERLVLFDRALEGDAAAEAGMQLSVDQWEATVTKVTYDLSPWEESSGEVTIDELVIQAEADPPGLRSDGQLQPVLDYLARRGWDLWDEPAQHGPDRDPRTVAELKAEQQRDDVVRRARELDRQMSRLIAAPLTEDNADKIRELAEQADPDVLAAMKVLVRERKLARYNKLRLIVDNTKPEH